MGAGWFGGGRGGCGVVTTGREKEKADLYSISVLIGVVWLRAYIHNCITYKPFLLWYVLVIPPLSFLGTYFFFKKKSESISTFPPLPPPGPPAPKINKKERAFLTFCGSPVSCLFSLMPCFCLSRFTLLLLFTFILFTFTLSSLLEGT